MVKDKPVNLRGIKMPKLKRKSQDQLQRESRERMSEARLNESPEETQKRQKYDALHVSSS